MSTIACARFQFPSVIDRQSGTECARYFMLGSCMRKFDFRKEDSAELA